MLDLKKLAESVLSSLANETTESIDLWFQEFENETIKSYLGNGEYSKEPVRKECYCLTLEACIVRSQSDNNSSEQNFLEAA